MRYTRLESDDYHDGGRESDVNKVFLFDSATGALDVFVPERAVSIPFDYGIRQSEDLLSTIGISLHGLGVDYVIHNRPVDGAYSAPFKIFLDITDECQLNCLHCLNHQLNTGKSMDLATIHNIAHECSRLGVFYVKLGGGEPLLHPHFRDTVRAFRRAGSYVSLSTNGLTVDSGIAEFLVENQVKITVSIEGPEEINDRIRGKGHFSAAVRSAEVLKSAGANVSLRMTLTKYVLTHMEEVLDYCLRRGLSLKIAYCRPSGAATRNEMLIDFACRDEYLRAIRLMNMAKYRGTVTMDEGMMIDQPAKLSRVIYRDRICGAANRSMHVNAACEISPCVFLGRGYKEPNRCADGDIEGYWKGIKGEAFGKVRAIGKPSECTSCSRLCKYECLATRMYLNGDFGHSDANCIRSILQTEAPGTAAIGDCSL